MSGRNPARPPTLPQFRLNIERGAELFHRDVTALDFHDACVEGVAYADDSRGRLVSIVCTRQAVRP